MVVIQGVKLIFINRIYSGLVYKGCVSEPLHYLADYVSQYNVYEMDWLNEVIDALQTTIDGNYSQLSSEDRLISTEFHLAVIDPTGVTFLRANHTYPLVEFRDMLLAWKTFLLTPPLDGTKLN